MTSTENPSADQEQNTDGQNIDEAKNVETQSLEEGQEQKHQGNMSTVELSVPWDEGGKLAVGKNITQTAISTSEEVTSNFILERTRVHQIYIQEQEKTKRLWLTLSVVSIIAALALIVFAPEGRETLSYWIGGALLIFAAGAAGYKRVWGRTAIFSVGADQDKREIE